MGGNNSKEKSLAEDYWHPDDEHPKCEMCETVFTFVRRRHHCRSCGGVFCAACSDARGAVVDRGFTKPVRMCHRCYNAARAGAGGRGGGDVGGIRERSRSVEPIRRAHSSMLPENTANSVTGDAMATRGRTGPRYSSTLAPAASPMLRSADSDNGGAGLGPRRLSGMAPTTPRGNVRSPMLRATSGPTFSDGGSAANVGAGSVGPASSVRTPVALTRGRSSLQHATGGSDASPTASDPNGQAAAAPPLGLPLAQRASVPTASPSGLGAPNAASSANTAPVPIRLRRAAVQFVVAVAGERGAMTAAERARMGACLLSYLCPSLWVERTRQQLLALLAVPLPAVDWTMMRLAGPGDAVARLAPAGVTFDPATATALLVAAPPLPSTVPLTAAVRIAAADLGLLQRVQVGVAHESAIATRRGAVPVVIQSVDALSTARAPAHGVCLSGHTFAGKDRQENAAFTATATEATVRLTFDALSNAAAFALLDSRGAIICAQSVSLPAGVAGKWVLCCSAPVADDVSRPVVVEFLA